jgi:hypothetical protein
MSLPWKVSSYSIKLIRNNNVEWEVPDSDKNLVDSIETFKIEIKKENICLFV